MSTSMLVKSTFGSSVDARRWAVELVGPSASAHRLREAVELAARSPAALIIAPAGHDAIGLARAIHARAGRAPLVVVDCGAADARTLERDVFGTRPARGMVDAVLPHAALARARGGTLVLVRITELAASLQARLSRIVRDGEVRVNGVGAVPFDTRLVATSDLPINREVQEGRFRKDLYGRLAAHVIEVPSFADRRDDIGPMAMALMEGWAAESGMRARSFTRASLALLAGLAWSGTLDQLRDMVIALASSGQSGAVRVEDILAQVDPGAGRAVVTPRASLRAARRQFERDYIAAVLRQSGGRMDQAARVLGMQRTNLYRKARQLGIARTRTGER